MARQVEAIRIQSEFDKQEFIRKAWEALAEDDVPIEVFECDFGDVFVNEHEIVLEVVSADVFYQASIGYDRQESYIDMETYYEKVPYTDYETAYENGVKIQKPVTKYRKEERQRQVTKYRTVTDWSPTSGTHNAKSRVLVENVASLDFDIMHFKNSITEEALKNATEEGLKTISDFTQAKIDAEHENDLSYSACSSLPGDHYRDFNYNIGTLTYEKEKVYMCSEYEAHITFNGKTYIKKCFPFGNATVRGDKIENQMSAEAFKERKTREVLENAKKRKESIPNKLWEKNGILSIVALAILACSFLFCIVVPVPALIIIMYILGVGAYVGNTILKKKNLKEIEEKVKKEEEAEVHRVAGEIADYTVNRRKRIEEALNKKMETLKVEINTASKSM